MKSNISLDSKLTPREIKEKENRQMLTRIILLFLLSHILHFGVNSLLQPNIAIKSEFSAEKNHIPIELVVKNHSPLPAQGKKAMISLYNSKNQLIISKAFLRANISTTENEEFLKVILEIPQDEFEKIVQSPQSYFKLYPYRKFIAPKKERSSYEISF